MVLVLKTLKGTLKGVEAGPGVQHFTVYKALSMPVVIYWSQQCNSIRQEGIVFCHPDMKTGEIREDQWAAQEPTEKCLGPRSLLPPSKMFYPRGSWARARSRAVMSGRLLSIPGVMLCDWQAM